MVAASSPDHMTELHRLFSRSGGEALSDEQKAELQAHMRKIKRIESDRRLFFFWVCCCALFAFAARADWRQIPVLIVILMLMAFNRGPQVWETTKLIARVVLARASRSPWRRA